MIPTVHFPYEVIERVELGRPPLTLGSGVQLYVEGMSGQVTFWPGDPTRLLNALERRGVTVVRDRRRRRQ